MKADSTQISVNVLWDMVALAAARGSWYVEADGRIRNEHGECPVCAGLNAVLDTSETFWPWYALEVCLARNLSPNEYRNVSNMTFGADSAKAPHRARMLWTLGLKERGAP